ncbi:unnamed protein product [Brassica rapa]|uniref:Uncharacterized protein n=2 Tax=Brassica TaxID=3705 RepID=A0A8D9LPR9_BRACM|nr:unnamed protein product [Brassica napus]CAG7882250.1 unnamed protein product [Brassica rapa]
MKRQLIFRQLVFFISLYKLGNFYPLASFGSPRNQQIMNLLCNTLFLYVLFTLIILIMFVLYPVPWKILV